MALLIAAVVFALVFAFSGVMFVRELRESKKEAETFEELAALRLPQDASSVRAESTPTGTAKPVSIPGPTAVTGDTSQDTPARMPQAEETIEPDAAETQEEDQSEEGTEERKPLKRYLPLYELNSDFFAWITIPGTNVDYPVMYNAKDPLKYLGHDFFGSFSYAGVPYMDVDCDPNGDFFLIYGHKMNDGSMFADLVSYDKKSFWETHKEIWFDTLYEERTYEVVLAMRAKVLDSDDETGFRYYDYTSLDTEEAFKSYMRQAKRLARYDTGVEVSFGDELLVLSTCYHYTTNGRFVIIAKRIA